MQPTFSLPPLPPPPTTPYYCPSYASIYPLAACVEMLVAVGDGQPEGELLAKKALAPLH